MSATPQNDSYAQKQKTMLRMVSVLGVFCLFFALMIGGLGYIQLVGKEAYGKRQMNLLLQAARQRQMHVELQGNRGMIVDRGGAVLADEGESAIAQHLLGTVGQNAPLLQKLYPAELSHGMFSRHQPLGTGGLQGTFDRFLQGYGSTRLSYSFDAHGRLLSGLGPTYTAARNPYYPMTVHTTLDSELQQAAERIVDAHGLQKGAVVVLDVRTSELLAMVSRPHRNRSAVDESWKNQALLRHAPGSIFKVVIAAAALDQGLVNAHDRFECHGKVEGHALRCWHADGHGRQSFMDAFANSCNVVFGQLAADLGPDTIERYARAMGLLQQNGWQEAALFGAVPFQQLEAEERGQVFAQQRGRTIPDDPLFLMQTGIGQQDVQVTPLAVANMMATIARGGQALQVKAVDRIEMGTGAVFHRFRAHPLVVQDVSPHSRFVMFELQKMLQEVTLSGTASQLRHTGLLVAGKTGTAQVSTADPARMLPASHHWFAGYYPANDPQYAVCVLSLDRPAHSPNQALSVFAALAERLR